MSADGSALTTPRCALTVLSLLVAACLVGSCGAAAPGAGHNKAGAAVDSTRVLRLEDPDPSDPEMVYLAQQIQRRSHGSLRVQVLADYQSALPSNEARLARAVRAGRVGFAFLAARAWPAAGVPAFAALQAPFVIDTYPAARAAAVGPAGRLLLGQLAGAGVVGLALVPMELRRLMSRSPLSSLADFHAKRLRETDNATTAADLRALGATPVQGLTAGAVGQALAAHRLDGVEISPVYALPNGYATSAHDLTGYALFDKMDTLVANPKAWSGLSASQQAVVRQAAADTVRYAATLPARDAADLNQLCGEGVRVLDPTPTALQHLAAAETTVVDSLRRSPSTADALALLQATPGAGPHALSSPPACRPVAHAAPAVRYAGPTIPNGTYISTDTAADFQNGGNFGPDWTKAITWTMRITPGHWYETQNPDYPDQGPQGGPLRYRDHNVTFVYVKQTPNSTSTPAPETVRWSYFKGQLTFTIVNVADPASRTLYAAHPWLKVR
jgi:TRAP-type C4-dicarboxylate transport system substrate-binding protein